MLMCIMVFCGSVVKANLTYVYSHGLNPSAGRWNGSQPLLPDGIHIRMGPNTNIPCTIVPYGQAKDLFRLVNVLDFCMC